MTQRVARFAAVHVCPCCGSALAAPSRLDGVLDQARLAPQGERVVRIVARRPGIDRRALADALFAERADGGPLSAEQQVATVVCAANRKLGLLGLRVAAGMGVRSGYHLIWGNSA